MTVIPDAMRGEARRQAGVRVKHFVPLLGFVVPTLGIGYGVVIPHSCIAGWNELSLGFASTVLGACLTYWAGLRIVVRERGQEHGEV